MASVRGMTPEAILALIKRELANVKLSEDQIRDLIRTNADIVDSIVNLEDRVNAGLTGDALDQLNLELQQLRSELQTQAAALVSTEVTLQENAQTLIDNQLEIASLSVLLSDGYLNVDTIKPGTILGEHIAAQTVTALNIAAGAIVSEKIAADAITSNHIISGAIVSEKIAADAITSTHIAADSVTTNKIASGAVTTNELAVGAVYAENISAEGISADLITAGSLSATRVELDGNDLATQMQFILSQLDSNFNALQVRFNDLEAYVEDRFTRPVFQAVYGMLDMPNNAFDPFMKWVNQSQEMYSLTGELATLALRVTKVVTSGQLWLLHFPETFEGRVQLYNNNTLVEEHVRLFGETYAYTINGSFDKIVWFAEAQTHRVFRWRQVFNEGGERVRNPSSGYGYLSPYRHSFNSGVTDTQINAAFQGLSRDSVIASSTSNRGTAGGSSYLVEYSTDGSSTTTEYPSTPGDPTTWYPMHLTGTVESAARSITIRARMRISQPKRSDRYGFLIYKNATYQGFVTGTGVGTLTGGSVLFSHEDIHLDKYMNLLLYKDDTITLVPVIMIIGAQPTTTAHIMEIDWDLQLLY